MRFATRTNMNLDSQIEAILFWKGEPLTIAELSRALHVPSGEVKQALRTLEGRLAGRGVTLLCTDRDVSLATASGARELIARLQKEELSRDLGRAALETLAIILYRAPVTRRGIEYIRGVNSTAILRSLLIRGLIERKQSESDDLPAPDRALHAGGRGAQAGRMFLYQPTIALLAHLGIRNREALPEFETVRQELNAFREEREQKEESEASAEEG